MYIESLLHMNVVHAQQMCPITTTMLTLLLVQYNRNATVPSKCIIYPFLLTSRQCNTLQMYFNSSIKQSKNLADIIRLKHLLSWTHTIPHFQAPFSASFKPLSLNKSCRTIHPRLRELQLRAILRLTHPHQTVQEHILSTAHHPPLCIFHLISPRNSIIQV